MVIRKQIDLANLDRIDLEDLDLMTMSNEAWDEAEAEHHRRAEKTK